MFGLVSPPGRYHMQKKLTFNLKPFSVSKVLPEGRGGFVKAKIVTMTLNNFMASADQEISQQHVPLYRIVRPEMVPMMADPDSPVQRPAERKHYIDPKEIPVWPL